jgi:RimJ/RimL family protein N-acetyltransferase
MIATLQNPSPFIETERLCLRLPRLADLDARAAMIADVETTRFIGGPQNREESWNRLLRYTGHWALLGYGFFAVEERASGRFVGEVGFCDFQRGLGSDFDPAPEAGWVIARWATGQGYASEALSAAIAWYEGHFGVGRAVCIIDPNNGASLRVAAKHGFTPFREAHYKDVPVILHERLPAPPQEG